MVGPKYAADYGRAVLDGFVRRELINIGEEVVNTAFGAVTEITGAQALDRGIVALQRLQQQIAPAQSNRHGPIMWGAAVQAALDAADRMAQRGGGIPGLSTGMQAVDDMLEGLERGTQTILAGRPSAGKSALGFQWLVAAARRGEACLAISQEMSAQQVARRALSAVSGVPVSLIKRGEHGRYAEELMLAWRELKDLPIMIEDGRGKSPAEMAGVARQCKQKLGRVDLLVLDHLQIAESDEVYPGDRRANSKANQIGQITGALCRISRDFDCAVLTLSQLNRDPEKRDDHRPNMGDLKGSGDIEQDAEKVMFLYREEMYLSDDAPEAHDGEREEKHASRVEAWRQKRERAKDRADLIIAKNRDGTPGTIKLRFQGSTTSFSELT
jgi:replicative DNA helicase